MARGNTASRQLQLLSTFSEDQRAAALARFELLRPALENCDAKRKWQ
jgi:hypothetical protein